MHVRPHLDGSFPRVGCERIAREQVELAPFRNQWQKKIYARLSLSMLPNCKRAADFTACKCKRTQTQPQKSDCRPHERIWTYSRMILCAQKKHGKFWLHNSLWFAQGWRLNPIIPPTLQLYSGTSNSLRSSKAAEPIVLEASSTQSPCACGTWGVLPLNCRPAVCVLQSGSSTQPDSAQECN